MNMNLEHPSKPLSCRAVVKPGLYAVIPKEGLVNNVVPPIENCTVSMIASPKMGASFVEYVLTMEPEGGAAVPYGTQPGMECFFYVIEGECDVAVAGKNYHLVSGGYAFAPDGVGISFVNHSAGKTKALLYKQRYIPLEGYAAEVVVGNWSALEESYMFRGDTSVKVYDFLPKHLGFDMNFHILSFAPGTSHAFVETHVQEHGAYVLEGAGLYYLDDRWLTIQKDDFIWFGPYVTQGSYAIGQEPFVYIYSKDCNRDAVL